MFKPTQTSLAVLSAQIGATVTTGYAIAALSGELASEDGWYQLLPDGEFSAIDGRPFDVPGGKWKMNADIAARLIQRAQLRANDLVIDYEHQTLKAEENGKPAPASGWFKEMQYRPGKGLYIKPAWLSAAKALIDAKEYRYLSAVFPYDKATGEPLEIQMAALTNYPGVDGMDAIASLAAKKFTTTINPQQGEPPMNPLLQQLLAAIGISVADGAEPTAEQGQAALAALTALKTKADSAEDLTTQVAALKANPGNIDLAKYVPIATYNGVVSELAVLRQQTTTDTVENLIEQAHKDGKVVAAERDYLTQLGNQNGVAVLKSVLAARPAIAALSATQTTQVKVVDKVADEELTQEDLAVLRATGLDKTAFLAAKKAKSA
ncbi:phage protease [Alishewanella jeotgali]|uniref:Prophage MuSo1, protein Gp32 n=1 Tax=Alishewanella jeotgali KCTC 22429 TaxID=1129374 RepID=H3ZIF5_9ALTE|nr:phage protease [Alishewanella jeotgali]EHR39605.1 prophage MuSo1, protein Gp32 [Alishewanella jeotgali KCTC 22429]